MLQMLRANKKIILILILASMIPRLITLHLMTHYDYDTPGIMAIEAENFKRLSLNILKYNTFSKEINDNPRPDNYMPPLYPLFYLLFVYFDIPYYVISIVQNILFTITVLTVYFLGRKIFREKTVRLAALLMALEPNSAFYTNFFHAQAIYYPVFTPAVLLTLDWLKTESRRSLYFTSFFLGIAALIKPVIIAIFPIIGLAIIFNHQSFKKTAYTLAMCAIIFAAIISPWLIRNRVSLGTWQFSSISDINLYGSNVHLFRQFFDIKEEPILPENYTPPVNDDGYRIETTKARGIAAKNFIKKYLFKYAAFHILYSPRIFIQDQYSDIIQMFSSKPLLSVSLDFYTQLAKFNLGRLLKDVRKLMLNPAFLVYIGGKLIWLTITMATFWSLHQFFKTDNPAEKRVIMFSLIFLLWYALIFSPVGRAGYRTPVNFLMFLLSLEFFFLPLCQWFTLKAKTGPAPSLN